VGEVEKRARKWMVKSEPEGSVMGIVKFGNELMWFSHFLLLSICQCYDWMAGRTSIPVVGCLPVFLCVYEPVSVHTESSVCLLILMCYGANLGVSKQMFHNLNLIGIDFHLEGLGLDLCGGRNLSVVCHDGCLNSDTSLGCV